VKPSVSYSKILRHVKEPPAEDEILREKHLRLCLPSFSYFATRCLSW